MDGQLRPARLVVCCLLAWLTVDGHASFASATEHDKYVCPEEFELFNSICYRLVADSPTDGVSARTACQDSLADSHLVYIQSQEVQTYIQSVADSGADYWIGLTFTVDTSQPHWLDGTPLGDYEAWESGDAFNDNSPCVRLRKESTPTHMWNDRSCGNSYDYICQIDAEMLTTTPSSVETTTTTTTTTTCTPGTQARARSSHFYQVAPVDMAAPADLYLIGTLGARSLPRCAVGCLRRADCLSFSYRSAGEGAPASAGLGNCRLHAKAFSASELTEQAHYRHYRF